MTHTEVPGPRGSLLLGMARKLQRDQLGTFESTMAEYGDVVRLVLGPPGCVDLGSRHQRAVLALLLAARRAAVRTDRLIDDLWRGEPPPRLSAQAMLAHIAGRIDDAERLYADACTHRERHGSPHAVGSGVLATVTIRTSQRRLAESRQQRRTCAHYGTNAVDATAAALAAAGRHDRARALLHDPPPLRPDFYFSVFATLRAMAVIAIGDRELAEGLYAALLPVQDQLAGAASTSLAMRPVAHRRAVQLRPMDVRDQVRATEAPIRSTN
jgi:hypothetical protein